MADGLVPGRGPGGGAQMRKRIPGSWTADKEDRFLLELSVTCNVSAAARAIKMQTCTLYKRRALDPGFREAWRVALSEGYEQLEQVLLARAIGGDRKPVWFAGKQVGSAVEYPDRIAMMLYAAHRAAGKAGVPEPSPDDADETRAKLLRRLKLIRAARARRKPRD